MLTYRELNRRANQLGHYLQMLRVEPEVLVGICSDRHFQRSHCLLLEEVDRACVPLAPAYPQHRLLFKKILT